MFSTCGDNNMLFSALHSPYTKNNSYWDVNKWPILIQYFNNFWNAAWMLAYHEWQCWLLATNWAHKVKLETMKMKSFFSVFVHFCVRMCKTCLCVCWQRLSASSKNLLHCVDLSCLWTSLQWRWYRSWNTPGVKSQRRGRPLRRSSNW